MNSRYEYRALLAFDIASSAGRGEERLQEIRRTLRAALFGSLDVAALNPKAFLHTDTGDGFQLVAPSGLLKARLLFPLLPELSARICTHNQQARPDTQLRVRVALHAGEIRIDPKGAVSGAPFEPLARLLDSAPLRQAVRTAPSGTPVTAVLSQHYYEETVVHGYEGLQADAFTAADVQVKEYAARAWLWYPGSPVGPRCDPAEDFPSGPGTPDPEPAGAQQIVRASDHGTAYTVQHGAQHIHHYRQGQ